MKRKDTFKQWMAAVAIALPALGILALTGCTGDETIETPANEVRTVTFTAVAPEGAGSRALWNDATNGKLGFEWEIGTDTKIDLYWTGATNPMQREATLDGHNGASVTVTGTAHEGATEVVALFPANTIQTTNGDEMYRTLPAELTQVGASTAHLRNYMYLNGTLAIDEVTNGAATMQLAHGCAVLRFNVRNSGGNTVRVTRVEMLAAGGKTGVNTRASITAGNVEDGISYSEPQSIAVAVQNALDDTKGYALVPGVGSLAVYAHCFPTAIEDGQFLFLVTVTDANGDNEKTYITKEAFSASGITTTDDADTAQKMFKAGYYYTFNLDIAGSRFEELPDYEEVKDEGGNVTGYIVNTCAGLQAWLNAIQDSGADIDLTLTADIDLTNADLDGVPNNQSNWPSRLVLHNVTIDGGGHTLTGLKMNVSGEGEAAAMFSYAGGNFVVKNLHLRNVQLSSSSYFAAGVVADNYGTVSGCSVSGTIESTADGYNAAGVVADNSGTVTACYNCADVLNIKDYAYVGGVVGYNFGTVTACYNTGKALATGTGSFAGGVIGSNSYIATVSACYWSGQDVTNGIGTIDGSGAANDDNATKVDGTTVTWNSTAMSAMNDALPAGFGWHYVENTDNATKEKEPLKLKVTP